MNFLRQKFLKNCQSGFSTVEALIATGILGTVVVGGTVHMKNVNHTLEDLRYGQTTDAFEHNLFKVLSDSRNIDYTVSKAASAKLKGCTKGTSTCKNGERFPVDLYLDKQLTPYAGKSVYFDKNGMQCTKNTCQNLQVLTDVVIYCGNAATCTKANQLGIVYSIVKLEGKKPGVTLHSGGVEVVSSNNATVTGFNLKCGNNQVISGVGFSGQAICENINKVKYSDKFQDSGLTLTVNPVDCRTMNDPNDPKDQHAIGDLNIKGELSCKPKTW